VALNEQRRVLQLSESDSLIYHLFPYSGLKQFARLICRNRSAEIIPLSLIASVTLEEFQLLPSFHALCDYPLL
jgi:hypothetical protein